MAKQYWFSFSPDPSTTSNLSPTFLNFAKFDGTSLTPPGITQPFTGTGLYQFTYTPTFSIAFKIDGATTGGGLTTLIRYVVGALDPIDRVDELLAEQGSTMSAIGMSNIALGVTAIGQGNTLIALGTTNVALGTTNVALGTTNVALGTTNIGYGFSNFALGTTAVSYGLLNFGLGTTNVALGTTNVALGTTNVALGVTSIGQGNTMIALGTTVVAIATTLMGFGTSLSSNDAAIGSTASSYGSSSADPVDLFGYMKRIREFLEGNQTFNKTTGSWSIYSRSSATLLITKTLTNAAAGVTRA